MSDIFERSKQLLGNDYLDKLNNKHVAVFGIGGVGGYVCETLVRNGINKISIYDNDIVSESNINRQLIALHSTLNLNKTDVMKNRLIDINPNCNVIDNCIFVDHQTIENIDFTQFDYIVDAIDTVTSKLLLIEKAKQYNIPIISSMGTGNKVDSSKLSICDLFDTSYCPLAKVMRRELKKRKIYKLTVLASSEIPLKPAITYDKDASRHAPGSVSFVPNYAGIKIGEYIIKHFLNLK